MSVNSAVFLTLCAAWLAMLLGDWLFPWFALPDLVLLAWIAMRFAWAAAPVWSPLLLVCLLMDTGAQVPLGFHALVHALCALLLIPGMARLRLSSGVEQLFAIAVVAIAATLGKGLLLYVMLGMPMPGGWPAAIVMPVMLWPFARALGELVMRPYIPRDEA